MLQKECELSTATARIGVIGGSGLYAMSELTDVEQVSVSTPFGEPSDAITIGTLAGERVAFLPRHARGHRILPSDIPVRANIYALKSLGVEWVIAASAVGSLREEIAPLHMVVPDQIIDRTKNRATTFFTTGLVGHVGFADPFCPLLADLLAGAAERVGATVHRGGTYVCMEGPAFSTRAESHLYRSWGASIIGMTALPEAKLAREAELHYAMIAQSTDYDCWRASEEVVSAEMVMANVARNIDTVRRTLLALVPTIPQRGDDLCANALGTAIQTAPDAISAEAAAQLGIIYQRYARR
jgi:5'-methylthioadenosine phosphorylase